MICKKKRMLLSQYCFENNPDLENRYRSHQPVWAFSSSVHDNSLHSISIVVYRNYNYTNEYLTINEHCGMPCLFCIFQHVPLKRAHLLLFKTSLPMLLIIKYGLNSFTATYYECPDQLLLITERNHSILINQKGVNKMKM